MSIQSKSIGSCYFDPHWISLYGQKQWKQEEKKSCKFGMMTEFSRWLNHPSQQSIQLHSEVSLLNIEWRKMTGLCMLIFTVMSMFNLFVSSRHQAFSIFNPEHHREACYLLCTIQMYSISVLLQHTLFIAVD